MGGAHCEQGGGQPRRSFKKTPPAFRGRLSQPGPGRAATVRLQGAGCRFGGARCFRRWRALLRRDAFRYLSYEYAVMDELSSDAGELAARKTRFKLWALGDMSVA